MKLRLHLTRLARFQGGAILLLLLLLSSQVQGEERQLERFEFIQIRMGVAVRMTLYCESSEVANRASEAAYARLKELDSILSDYDPDSELNQLCQSPAGHPVRVSEDLFRVLSDSQMYWNQSQGLFDPSIGPIVKLWRIARRSQRIPPSVALENALKKVGFHQVTLDEDIHTVTLAQSGMQLDFGGIGKGYGAEEAYRVLFEHRVPVALVAVSGEIRVGDPPPGRTGWTVEVETRSADKDGEPSTPIRLSVANKAISTSGDTYQFVEIDGKRFSHIVNPTTGLGMTTSSNVTIVANDSTKADALATIVSLLGAQAGIQYLKENAPETEAYVVTLDADQNPSTAASAGWDSLLKNGHEELSFEKFPNAK